MADLSITAANVVPGTGASVNFSNSAGETIAAGKAVYKSGTTKKWMLADSNSGTDEVRRATGIAVNSAALNQPLAVVENGPVTLGAVLTAGVAYYLSDTPGGICPVADVGSGEYVCQLGIATSTSSLNTHITYPNVAL
jgi:hypothetical protein